MEKPLIDTISKWILLAILNTLNYINDKAVVPLLRWMLSLIGDAIKHIVKTIIHFLIKYVLFYSSLFCAVVFVAVWIYSDYDLSVTFETIMQFVK